MSEEQITQIKLACLEQAKFQCQNHQHETLKVAKELFDWVIDDTKEKSKGLFTAEELIQFEKVLDRLHKFSAIE